MMDTDFIKEDMVPKSVPRSSFFQSDTLRQLSAKMDPCDTVSLLYLMTPCQSDDEVSRKIYEKLSSMDGIISAKAVDFPKLCQEYIKGWENKIIEALVEIQLFDALLDVFHINKLDAKYNVSMNDSVLNPNKVKIFRVCDGLEEARRRLFLGRMEELLGKGCMPPMEFAYLELYFMFWQLIGKITPNGLGIELVHQGLQVTGSDPLLAMFLPPGKLTEDDYTLAEYPILDTDKVGLCVIVNESEFDDHRNNRPGSIIDEKSLSSVMESLNFDVVTRHNLSADEMALDIKRTINTNFNRKRHSILFLAIMSHGEDGRVMGREGKYESTKHIVKALYEARGLKRLPKVLVVCACRGTAVFSRAKGATYEADGPADETVTLREDVMDIITCFSTIPGFISLRNKEKGTLFMQVFCDVLKKRADLEICELFTTVNKALMNPKQFNSYNPLMLAHPCEFNSRLLKKLYLKKSS